MTPSLFRSSRYHIEYYVGTVEAEQLVPTTQLSDSRDEPSARVGFRLHQSSPGWILPEANKRQPDGWFQTQTCSCILAPLSAKKTHPMAILLLSSRKKLLRKGAVANTRKAAPAVTDIPLSKGSGDTGRCDPHGRLTLVCTQDDTGCAAVTGQEVDAGCAAMTGRELE